MSQGNNKNLFGKQVTGCQIGGSGGIIGQVGTNGQVISNQIGSAGAIIGQVDANGNVRSTQIGIGNGSIIGRVNR